ncbi:MAG: hypothetical protein Q7T20_17275 [Saprospiraceae bacterium]|nr:hypothetical protein [Saprospiraceae bacterium]
MNCNGTGICKINITNFGQRSPAKKSCQLTFAIASTAPNGIISLYFFRELLCIQLYRKHFRKGIMRMAEACPIPTDLAKGLNIKSKTMLPGNYAVEELDGYFRVDLDCA